MTADKALADGFEALRESRWPDARSAFEASIARRETPEALEGLASAAFWLDDATTAITCRERAYRMYQEQKRSDPAARAAAQLAADIMTFRGDPAVASGWLGRARDLVRDRPDSPALPMITGIEASVAAVYRRDLSEARRLTEEAIAHARRHGRTDEEMIGTAQLGLICVESGDVVEGLSLLDRATAAAISGELISTEAAVRVSCFLVTACLELRDLDRAGQWARYAVDLGRGQTTGGLFDYPRTEHAGVLMLTGHWAEAESDLRRVIDDSARRPRAAAIATIRLAELRRRQGRLAEASALLDRLEHGPSQGGLGSRVQQLRAAVALDGGDPAMAASIAERLLRGLPETWPLDRVDALEIIARARAATGEFASARAAATELATIAAQFGTDAIRAVAAVADATIAAVTGDIEAARVGFEQAVARYGAAGMPFEAARARLELARCLQVAGDAEAALHEAQAALDGARRLGARDAVERAKRFLREVRTPVAVRGTTTLTTREEEILRLVAAGRSNEEIAEVLVLSVRTVERHISNIYAKLGATGRTARAIATAYALSSGTTQGGGM